MRQVSKHNEKVIFNPNLTKYNLLMQVLETKCLSHDLALRNNRNLILVVCE